MRNGGWLGTIRPPQSSGGIITPNKLWPGQGGTTPVVIPTPVAWWKMNEGSGATLIDTIATNNMPFTASIGSWGAVAGFPGTPFTFNGTQTISTCPIAGSAAATNFANTQPFSVSAWISVPTPSIQQSVIANLAFGFLQGWHLEIASSHVTAFLCATTVSTEYILVESVASIQASTVTHIGFTYNGSGLASGITLYLNGVPTSGIVLQDTLGANSMQGGALPSIGSTTQSSSPLPLTGTIEDVRVWNSQLSAAQMALVFSGGIQ